MNFKRSRNGLENRKRNVRRTDMEDYKKKYEEIFGMKKVDLLYLIENLMMDGKIDITDITICHTRYLESKLAAKDKVIFEADNCIFESVFTDSIGKPASDASLQRKLEWLDKVGMHNMEGIFKYLRNESKV